DRTITGTALVALGLSTLIVGLDSHYANAYVSGDDWWLALRVAAGLLLILVSLYPRTTRALARGCLLCGVGLLALTAIALVFRLTGWSYFGWTGLTLGAVSGVTLIVASGIALGRARRSAELPTAAAGG